MGSGHGFGQGDCCPGPGLCFPGDGPSGCSCSNGSLHTLQLPQTRGGCSWSCFQSLCNLDFRYWCWKCIWSSPLRVDVRPALVSSSFPDQGCGVPLLRPPFPPLLVDHFWMFTALCVLFGFLTGQWIAATSPLLVSLLGIQQLSQAFGLLTAVRGMASLISPPLAGLLVDLTTNPMLALYLSGMLLMSSGLVYTIATWMFRRKIRLTSYEEI